MFCTRSECSVGAHAEKMSFFGTMDTVVFINQVEGRTAFVKPSVEFARVSTSVWDDWEGQTWTFDSWNLNFQAVENTGDQLASSDDIKKETTFLAKAELFKTPSKRKREDVVGDSTQQLVSDLKSMRYERRLPVLDEADEGSDLVLKPGMLTSVVAGIETNLVMMNEGLEEIAILASSRLQANEEDLLMLSGMVGNIRSSIGSPVEMDPSLAAPTMWGAMALMADEIIRSGGQVKGSLEAFQPFRELTLNQLRDLKAGSEAIASVVGILI